MKIRVKFRVTLNFAAADIFAFLTDFPSLPNDEATQTFYKLFRNFFGKPEMMHFGAFLV